MNKTVKEWIDFLGGEDVKFCIKSKSTHFCKENYFTREEIYEDWDAWLDDEVINVWYNNLGEGRHLLIIK